MTPTHKKLIVLSLTVLFLVAVALFSSLFFKQKQEKSTSPVRDLSSHPIYSKYHFDDSAKVINFGTQPLYSPTGFITETMKRDAILTRELASLGFTVHYYSFLKGVDVNYFMLRRDLDVGVGGDMPALSLASKTSIIIPSLIQQGPISIVTRKYLLFNDLQNKRIAYPFGSIAHFALLDLLEGVDIQEEDVELVPMDVNKMAQALSAGKIDAFAAWEPTPELAKLQYGFVKNFQSMSSGYLYFRKDIYDGHPAVVRQLLAAQIRAFRWLNGDHDNLLRASSWVLEEIAFFTGEKIKLTAEQNAYLVQKDLLGKKHSTIAIQPESLKKDAALYREYNFLKKLGKLPPDTDWQQVLDSFNLKVIREIHGNPEHYVLDEFEYIGKPLQPSP